jgi:hypothetical protein
MIEDISSENVATIFDHVLATTSESNIVITTRDHIYYFDQFLRDRKQIRIFQRKYHGKQSTATHSPPFTSVQLFWIMLSSI